MKRKGEGGLYVSLIYAVAMFRSNGLTFYGNAGSSHMTWKQKKDLENRKVVSLGGKVLFHFLLQPILTSKIPYIKLS